MSRVWPAWKNMPILGRYTHGRLQVSSSNGGTTIPRQRILVNPRTGQPSQVIVQDTSVSQVKSSIISARQAQISWASLPGTVRRNGMLALAQVATTHKGLLAQLGCLETGKPYADSMGEVDEVIECLRHFAGYADKPRGVSLAEQDMHFTTQPEPIGVCGLITSYNYPIMLTGWKLAPALAAGNSVIIKPAPQTPLTTLALAELSNQVLPTDVIQVLPGGLETGQAIVAGVDKTSFTGSTPAGQAIMRQAANHLQPLTLECGGKNTVIIDADADLANAAYHVAQGAFSNTGQNCCAASRILVHSRVHDAFVALLQEETKRWKPVIVDQQDEKKGNNDDNDDTTYYYGPLIDQQQFDRVQRYLTHSTLQPAFTAPALPTDQSGYYIPPTVYVGVDDYDPLAQDEIFGPVLSILSPFDTIEEAVARANTATPFGLAAGVFSEKYATSHSIASQLQTGIVWINTYNAIPASVPFGGRKLSGFGKDLGRNALDEFSFTKSILHAL